MESVNTIKDTRIRVKLSQKFVDIIKNNETRIKQIPENISNSLKTAGVCISTDNVVSADRKVLKPTATDIQLLNELLKKNEKNAKLEVTSPPKQKENSRKAKKDAIKPIEIHLYLSDLRWLDEFLCSLRADSIVDVYLNDLLESCHLELPKNEVTQRNPVLEARCKRLREEQQNREYRKMTKNVDATLKHYPEDTIAYQMNAINSQIIAVLQFIFSVAAGFAFGFIGIDLIIGGLDFGLRLLLGVMMALIIALAEIYFLAMKLNEYDRALATANKAISKTIPAKAKQAAGGKQAATGKSHKD